MILSLRKVKQAKTKRFIKTKDVLKWFANELFLWSDYKCWFANNASIEIIKPYLINVFLELMLGLKKVEFEISKT